MAEKLVLDLSGEWIPAQVEDKLRENDKVVYPLDFYKFITPNELKNPEFRDAPANSVLPEAVRSVK